ncbi:cytotoxic T-lymphocyte protein 4-like [Carcharodon carcharias]|uniref:cytotoxic T-lymphocyte protein 4-like n=1 Tax=Carcharodon carcharias TaxID=13397 RepID=UPI001B7F0B3F|nr:cytotoxic T-lymphocyte protein 4-like [Carcharodon carcharias]
MDCLRNLLVVFLWMHTACKLDAGLKISQPVLLEVESTGEATLECAHNYDENTELKLTILKGRVENVACIGTTNSSVYSVNSTGLLQCRITRKRYIVSVTLCGLNSSLIDNYFCKIEKLYPPPYEGVKGNGTIIYTRSEKCSQFLLLLSMGILGSMTLSCMIYSIVLTLMNCRAKKLIKKEEENSVYERMAPSTGGEQSRRNTESAATLCKY